MKTRRRNHSDDLSTVNRRNKRVKTSETGGENALSIPIDLVCEIFSRLSLKCIARCRCVSKVWASMLRRPEFAEFFSSKSYARPQFLFVCSYGKEFFVFSSPQPQNLGEHSSLIPNYHMSFSFDGNCRISGVVNGLVFFKRYKCLSNGRNETFPVICNPSTGESLSLKKVNTSRSIVKSMFGYDPIDRRFKVLSMTWGHSMVDEEHQVLTLGTDKWRMVDYCIPRHQHYLAKELCINGVLYYQTPSALCCFDIRSEKFSFIKLHKTIRFSTLINYCGNLGLIGSSNGPFDQNSTSLKLWVLEDVERQEWSKRNLMLPPHWESRVGKHTLGVLGVTGPNEIVFQVYRCHPPCLFYLNTANNTMVRVDIQGMDSYKYDGIDIFMNHVENVGSLSKCV